MRLHRTHQLIINLLIALLGNWISCQVLWRLKVFAAKQKFCSKVWEENPAKNAKVEDFLHFIWSGKAFQIFGSMDGWTDGRTDGRTDGWMDGWMDGSMETY